MDKKTIDCIQADIDKKNKEKKEKEELIQKIYDFFKDLPEGEYTIGLHNKLKVKVLKKNPMFSKQWFKDPIYYDEIKKDEPKEPWVTVFHCDRIIIQKIDKKVFIRKSSYYDYLRSPLVHLISNWPEEQIQIFYDHLDWFEKELAEQYCEKHNS